MLVGLLAKLVAALILILLAVGVFVGGEKFVSLLDRADAFGDTQPVPRWFLP